MPAILASQATHLPPWTACSYLVLVLDFLGRAATGRSLSASSESRYLPAVQEEDPSDENSVTEVFVPCRVGLEC